MRVLLLALILAGASGLAQAQDYPSRPITLIIPTWSTRPRGCPALGEPRRTQGCVHLGTARVCGATGHAPPRPVWTTRTPSGSREPSAERAVQPRPDHAGQLHGVTEVHRMGRLVHDRDRQVLRSEPGDFADASPVTA